MTRKAALILIAIMFAAAPAFATSAKYAKGNFVPADRMLSQGEVRAEIIKDSTQFLGGPKREARVGDFKMHNNVAGFVIAGTRLQNGVFMYGGIVEEAGILKPEDGGARWYNLMGDTSFFMYKGVDPVMGGRMLAPVKAELVSDGADGAAVVRIYAVDAEWPERKEVVNRSSSSFRIRAIIDYILKPDSPVLEMKLTLMNGKDKNQVVSFGQLFLTGDGSSLFAPEHGFDITEADGKEFPIFTSIGGGASYGWFPADGDMTVNKNMQRRLITTFGKVRVPSKGEAEFTMYMAVAGGGYSAVAEEMYRFKQDSGYAVITGKCVTEGTGEAAPDAVVHALTPEGAMASNSDVEADGTYRLVLPAGKYTLQAAAYDRTAPEPIPVEAAAGETATADIELASPAVVKYEIKDTDGNDIPAVVSFKKKDNSSRLGDDFFYNRTTGYGSGYFKIHFAGPEAGSVNIRPGDYDVYISRGLEYEISEHAVSLGAGETAEISATLAHSVNTDGYLSGDFHIHSQPSNDVNDLVYEKVRAAAGLGLEVAIATDHDAVTDYTPYINELGLQNYVNSIMGDELTTIWKGHFNAYPLTYDPTAKNWGAPVWFGLSVPEIMKAFRDDPKENTIVQINHPRSSGGGYFNIINYDSETATAEKDENFSLNFDAMEVLNGAGYDETEKSLPDWYSFLIRGKPVTGVGNSDNHSTYNLGLGYPRNYVKSKTDEPAEMNEDEFIAAVRAAKLTMNGGAFITVNVNGIAGPGETATETGGKVELNIKVQAPTWVGTKTLTVTQDGKDVRTVDISAEKSVVRFDGKIIMDATADTWYVVRVDGEKSLFPVYPGARAFSFTNPVYVDTDGNGVYDAPMAFAEK